MKRIIIRADACRETGMGHFMRSLAFGGMVKDDYDVAFTSYCADSPDGIPAGWQLKEIAGEEVTFIPLQASSIAEFDEKFIEEARKYDTAVLDNYYYSTLYQQRAREAAGRLIVIDDMGNHHTPADMLISFCPLPRNFFSTEPYTKYLSGPEYTFLRKPFRERPAAGERHWPPHRIFIAMGGTDPLNIGPEIQNYVKEILPETVCDLVRGGLSAAEIAAKLDEADLAIVPASTICMEALSRNLPVAAGFFIDNQIPIYRYAIKQGWISPLGRLTESNSLRENLIHLLRGEDAPQTGGFSAQTPNIESLKRYDDCSRTEC